MSYNAVAFLEGLFLAEPRTQRGTVSVCEPMPPNAATGVEDLPGDWRVWFEERAAIIEYDGGLPRERAEAEALVETVRLMRDAARDVNR